MQGLQKHTGGTKLIRMTSCMQGSVRSKHPASCTTHDLHGGVHELSSPSHRRDQFHWPTHGCCACIMCCRLLCHEVVQARWGMLKVFRRPRRHSLLEYGVEFPFFFKIIKQACATHLQRTTAGRQQLTVFAMLSRCRRHSIRGRLANYYQRSVKVSFSAILCHVCHMSVAIDDEGHSSH